jgi:L-alanine-DL-glutamate epimerase-like enolase superfamily enzyme
MALATTRSATSEVPANVSGIVSSHDRWTRREPFMTQVCGITPFGVCYPEPNDDGNLRYLLFVRVEAEDGTVGWGEAITQFPEATAATRVLVEALAEHVIGSDPMENVAIWRRLKDKTWWYGYRGGPAAFAIAAIDIALWDLKGKLLGQPLVDLIGGAHRERVPALASTHAFNASIEYEAERHGRYVRDEGYVGVKIGMGKRGDARLGYDVARDVEFVRLLRDAVGPDAWIMMDRGQSLVWDLSDAIRRTTAFEEYDLKWIEEPFEPQDFESLRKLRQQVGTLLAGGEREWDARGFGEIIDTGLVDVIGCDIGRAEGITGALRVIRLVEEADLWFNSHAWSSAVNTAASIALSASTPRCLLQELKPDPGPMQHDLVDAPFAQADGWIDVLRAPGLGVVPREDVLERYRWPR